MSFIEKLNWRYATKKFDQQEISQEDLSVILEAVKLTPTSFGLQPFHVTVVKNHELKETLKALSWNQEQLTSCSHVLVFSSRTDFMERTEEYFKLMTGGNKEIEEKVKGYREMIEGTVKGLEGYQAVTWAGKQAYIALGFALVACAELNIDSCPMEGFDRDGFKKALDLPDHIHPQVMLTVGYRHDSEVVRPKVRFGEKDLFDFR